MSDFSTIPTGLIGSGRWEFRDANISNVQHPAHQYSLPGTYAIWLIVAGNALCASDTIDQQVRVGDMPLVDFTLPAVCLLDANPIVKSVGIKAVTMLVQTDKGCRS
ncbi:MAG: hypothetical protein H7Y86_11070 [Rhizobacter sp.]|nr:hypothetical protein [Ferruginibacter sp.]